MHPLFRKIERLSDELRLTQAYILRAVEEAGLALVPAEPSNKSSALAAAHARLDDLIERGARQTHDNMPLPPRLLRNWVYNSLGPELSADVQAAIQESIERRRRG